MTGETKAEKLSNFKSDLSPLQLALPTESLRRGPRRALVLIALATVAVVEMNVLSPLRSILVLLFMSTVPGAAVMSFTRRTDSLTIAALSVGFSLAICAALASIAVWAHQYNPRILFLGTAITSVALLFLAPWYRILVSPSSGFHSRVQEGELVK